MGLHAYPAHLPGPLAAPYAAADLRMQSSLPGPRQLRPMQRAREGTEELDFCFSHDGIADFTAWLEGPLEKGGNWFSSNWPRPKGGMAARRFIGYPSPAVFYQSYGWHVHATCLVREISVPEAQPAAEGGGSSGWLATIHDQDANNAAQGNTGSEPFGLGSAFYYGSIIGYTTGVVLWIPTWEPVGTDPMPSLSGFGDNDPRIEVHLAFFDFAHPFRAPEGLLTLVPTIDGIPFGAGLQMSIGPGDYSPVAWGPTP